MPLVTRRTPTIVAPPTTTAAIRARLTQGGIIRLAEELGSSREVIARIAAGLPVRRGSIAVVENALAAATGPSPSRPPAEAA